MNATAPQPSATTAKTVVMTQDKICKGSIRYAVPKAEVENSTAPVPVTNIYVEKGAFAPAPMPRKIKVTVECAD